MVQICGTISRWLSPGIQVESFTKTDVNYSKMVKDGTVLAIPLHPAEGTSRSRATSIPRKRGGLVAKCDISR